MQLTFAEARVVASLAEKSLATPQNYPLTMQALRSACNQSSNREPVVDFDEETIVEALDGLRAKGYARVRPAGGGDRTTKYRQVLDEALGLDARELALLTVLLLRGAQTRNELRTRTERLADFDGEADVEHDLQRLADRPEPLAVLHEREPGRREPRWSTPLVGEESESTEDNSAALTAAAPSGPVSHPLRVPPVADDDLDDQQRELLQGVAVPGGTVNIFRTLVRHPGLFRKWMPFGGKLLNGKVPARERELAILRVGWLCRADYEWGQHVPIGKRAGLTVDEIARIPAGPSDPSWSELDRAVLSATDELHRDATISDATWRRLSDEFDEKQLIELVMVIGHYHLVSFALNSLGVEREPGVEGLPDS